MRGDNQVFQNFPLLFRAQPGRDRSSTFCSMFFPFSVMATMPPPETPRHFHLIQFCLHFAHARLHFLRLFKQFTHDLFILFLPCLAHRDNFPRPEKFSGLPAPRDPRSASASRCCARLEFSSSSVGRRRAHYLMLTIQRWPVHCPQSFSDNCADNYAVAPPGRGGIR